MTTRRPRRATPLTLAYASLALLAVVVGGVGFALWWGTR